MQKLRKHSEVVRERAGDMAKPRETGAEQAPDVSVEQGVVSEAVSQRQQEPPVQAPITESAPVHKDPHLKVVERTLAGDLVDVYKALPPDLKPAFKAKGEEVAQTINGWMRETKIAAKQVLKLIKEWLSMIPKVNRHYLEQESKIKTDHIMGLYEEFQRGEIE